MMLEENAPKEFVMGAVGKFWRLDSGIVRIAPSEFPGFEAPGFAKGVLTFTVEERDRTRSVLATETRVACTDPSARQRFLLYWRAIGPFSGGSSVVHTGRRGFKEIIHALKRGATKRPDFVLRSSETGEVIVGEMKAGRKRGSIQSGREKALAHKPGKGKDVHVTPRESGNWAVKKSGAERASSVHDRKADAVKVARQAAAQEKSELVVHNRDGKISAKDSHGHDPRKSKG